MWPASVISQVADQMDQAGHRQAAIDLLRPYADDVRGADYARAAVKFANLLAKAGHLDELRQRADTGDRHAADWLVWLLTRVEDLDGLREQADIGNVEAAETLAEKLIEAGDQQAAIDVLRPHADADASAAQKLARLLDLAGNRRGAMTSYATASPSASPTTAAPPTVAAAISRPSASWSIY